MKPRHLFPSTVAGLAALLLTGCLLRTSTVTPRSFVLSPMAAPEARGALAKASAPVLGVGRVRLPQHLMRSALAVRRPGGEVRYLESALWAERLDLSFQRALAANLAILLPTDQIRLTAWNRDEVAAALHVTVDRFDVDESGRGTLVAWWRIELPGAEKPLRSGASRITREGPELQDDPGTLVEVLNGLTEDFSREMAGALRDVTLSR